MDQVSQNKEKKLKTDISPHLTVNNATDIFVALHTNRANRCLAITLSTTRFNSQSFYMVLAFGLRVLYGPHNNSDCCLTQY